MCPKAVLMAINYCQLKSARKGNMKIGNVFVFKNWVSTFLWEQKNKHITTQPQHSAEKVHAKVKQNINVVTGWLFRIEIHHQQTHWLTRLYVRIGLSTGKECRSLFQIIVLALTLKDPRGIMKIALTADVVSANLKS